MESIRVRYATKADAELIADFSRKTFYEAFSGDNTEENMELFMKNRFSRELLMAEVDAPGNIFLLAYSGDELVGYARLRENNNPPSLEGKATLEIARIYSATHTIGKGVGKALMNRSIEIAVEKNKEIIWLGVWEKNLRAIEFYTRWGFEKFNDHEFLLGNDRQRDWLMKKHV